jgi:HSP20 family protein
MKMRYDPFEEMRRFQREMNKLFDSFWRSEFPKRLPSPSKGLSLLREPLADLKETDKELIASIEIPGVDKKDIQLTLTENNLEVKVEKKTEAKIEKKGYIRAERSYRGFYKSIALPVKVIPEKSKATYKNGILEVVMPKAEKKKQKKAKKIEIS